MTDATRPPRGYSWPPFQPGHMLSVQHAAYSPRLLEPLAEARRAELLADPSLAYLAEPWAAGAVKRYSMAQAVVDNVWSALSRIDEALAADDVAPKARAALERRRQSALELLHRFIRLADNQAHRLGLDALSRAEIARALAPKLDLAREWMEMDDEDDPSTVDGVEIAEEKTT